MSGLRWLVTVVVVFGVINLALWGGQELYYREDTKQIKNIEAWLETEPLAKLQIYKGLEVDLETALAQAFADAGLAMQTEDFKEAITAFAQKRQPQYKGR